nr:MAG TPA: hypothetical protein [Caudoviricetes sp.]
MKQLSVHLSVLYLLHALLNRQSNSSSPSFV